MPRPTIVRMLGLGKKIKKYRTDANLTQRKMAKLLGIPYSTYSNYENDNRTPDSETLQRICDILNISMQDLIGQFASGSGGDESERISELIYRPIIPFTPENMAAMAREQDMISSFRKLNVIGQMEAKKRLEELTEIPRYRREEAPEPGTPTPDTPRKETPTEDA